MQGGKRLLPEHEDDASRNKRFKFLKSLAMVPIRRLTSLSPAACDQCECYIFSEEIKEKCICGHPNASHQGQHVAKCLVLVLERFKLDLQFRLSRL